MSDLLLEIGCENLPPAAIAPAAKQLRELTGQRLSALRLSYGDIYTTGAPRRLVLIVRGLAASQAKASETVTGPPLSRAFDESGVPTKAALGFAKSQGVDVKALQTIDTDRGAYLGIERKLESKRTAALLREELPELIAALRFPKVMHWEPTGVRFGRPIRWIVCVLGKSVIKFSVAGVKSGDVTYAMPWIRRRSIRVTGPDQYLRALERAGVTVDHDERSERIRKLAARAADRLGVKLIVDDGLVEELTFMLEEPVPLVGDFDKAYLSLPLEIVVTAMRSHQRYMAFTKRGRLVPKFLTFTEGRVGSPATVRHGNEKVLRARLDDARFYWNEDVRTGIDGLADKLDNIVFIEGLGTLGQKARRIGVLSRRMHDMSAPAASGAARALDADTITRAARISKADLASEMIKDGKEFTLLQGVMGSFYAAEAGAPAEVVEAIRDQYLPRNPGDPMPKTELGALLSMAERLDTIVGCFLAGITPTGSQDPYALRRQANGLLRMLESRPQLSLQPLVEQALGSYQEDGLGDRADAAAADIESFFRNRVELWLRDRGIAYDVVAAVSAVSWSHPATAARRARAIEAARGDAHFELLITGAKRVGNILSDDAKVFGAGWDEIERAFDTPQSTGSLAFDRDAFADDDEKRLDETVSASLPAIIAADRAENDAAVIGGLAGLGPPIDRYFDSVLVNAKDERLRNNRHRFLSALFALFSRYADFSHIVEDPAVVQRGTAA